MSQIFKEDFDITPILEFLKDIGIEHGEYVEISNESYKKAVLNNSIIDFIEYVKDHYYESKKIYTERKMNYNRFITILRQVLKYKKIQYKSNIRYNKSSYSIFYYIHIHE
jgi:hypothetical protein